jgi:hypothetical protein
MWFRCVLVALLLCACKHSGEGASEVLVAADPRFTEIPRQTPLEREADVVFRDLLAWHMAREGFIPDEALEAAYLTPPEYKKQPTHPDPSKFLDILEDRFSKARVADFYDYGKENPPTKRAPSMSGAKLATIIVVPGIFGEFIKNYPFHEIVTNEGSVYHKTWQSKIDAIEDEVYSLYELNQDKRALGQLLKLGSYDIDGKPWVNVVMLVAKEGSCETLGTIDSAIPAYLRRLDKLFATVEDDSDLYFMGYSRGEVVALEMARQLASQQTAHPWSRRVKGVIGLAGVYYGAQMAELALTDPKLPAAKALGVLRRLKSELKDQSTNPNSFLGNAENARNIVENTRIWAQALKDLQDIGAIPPPQDEITKALQEENAFRSREYTLQAPSVLGNLDMLINFAFKSFRLDDQSKYWHNIRVLKVLTTRAIEGIDSLTPASRITWWRQNQFPPHLKLFSLTGSMPDAFRDGELSPLFGNEFYGQRMVDFNGMLRSGFYDLYRFEKTQLNDSQVTWYHSRFWPGIFPSVRNRHYYLGMMGTHHWGIAFPTAAVNADGSVNRFPRSALMAAVASFLYETARAGAN